MTNVRIELVQGFGVFAKRRQLPITVNHCREWRITLTSARDMRAMKLRYTSSHSTSSSKSSVEPLRKLDTRGACLRSEHSDGSASRASSVGWIARINRRSPSRSITRRVWRPINRPAHPLPRLSHLVPCLEHRRKARHADANATMPNTR